MSAPLRILHQAYLRNGAWGGMEKSLAGFLAATRNDPDLESFLIENLRDAAPPLREALSCLSAPAREVRRWHGLPVPGALRAAHRRSVAARWRVDRVLNWNQVGDMQPARLASRLGAASIYWERGAAWFAEVPGADRGFVSAYDLYLANSEASRQMLRQRWQVSGDIQLCTPGLSHLRRRAPARALRSDRPLRLGFCARLRAFKGGVLAVHALRELRARGLDAQLWIAGEGPDAAALHMQVDRLGLAPQVRFLGWVGAIDPFLAAIDLLLHPALREPYGIACAEALVRGVPVVAARVDGLPEVIEDGVDGLCVTPSLPLSDFGKFGGDRGDVYPLVYRPESGTVAEPGLADPQALADAVETILGDATRYAAFSTAAGAAAAGRFSWAGHLRRFKELVGAAGSGSFASTPGPASPPTGGGS